MKPLIFSLIILACCAHLSAHPHSGTLPECRSSEIWADEEAEEILSSDPSCPALCELVSFRGRKIPCEHETGGRGYERSFYGYLLRYKNLGCLVMTDREGQKVESQKCFKRKS
jgi:hypothetical protein